MVFQVLTLNCQYKNHRMIITLSQKKGEISVKEKDQINQRQIFEEVKNFFEIKQI